MNRKMIARELLGMAKELMAMEFDTQDAMDKYMKDHPDANRSNHKVKQTKKDAPAKKEDYDNASYEELKKMAGPYIPKGKTTKYHSRGDLLEIVKNKKYPDDKNVERPPMQKIRKELRDNFNKMSDKDLREVAKTYIPKGSSTEEHGRGDMLDFIMDGMSDSDMKESWDDMHS